MGGSSLNSIVAMNCEGSLVFSTDIVKHGDVIFNYFNISNQESL